MKPFSSEPVPQIPRCNIHGRLISAYDFLPRLKKLCSALGFNNPIIEKRGHLPLPLEVCDNNYLPRSHPRPVAQDDGRDQIIILSTTVPYEQSWGGYNGLPGQFFRMQSSTRQEETPSDFIRPYLQQYQCAREHIHVGSDNSGNYIVTLPDYLISGQKYDGGKNLKVILEKIARPSTEGQYFPLSVSGPIVTFALGSYLRDALGDKLFMWKSGMLHQIGDYLHAEMFRFDQPTGETHNSNPFAAMLFPRLPWIVTHKTPHLAATLVHLQTNFAKISETFAATGTDDLRNRLCVAGLDIDMRGFRGRSEGYFVPWQACWKRNGYCYDNIYPLEQDDLLVALNSSRWEKNDS